MHPHPDHCDTQRIRLYELAERIGRIGHWSYDLASGEMFWSREIYRICGLDPATIDVTFESALASHTKSQY